MDAKTDFSPQPEEKEKPAIPCGTTGFVELLPRFELGTSSLPILPELFSPTAPCLILLPGTVATQWFRAYPSFSLTHLAVLFHTLIFDVRMGFVWVSILF